MGVQLTSPTSVVPRTQVIGFNPTPQPETGNTTSDGVPSTTPKLWEAPKQGRPASLRSTFVRSALQQELSSAETRARDDTNFACNSTPRENKMINRQHAIQAQQQITTPASSIAVDHDAKANLGCLSGQPVLSGHKIDNWALGVGPCAPYLNAKKFQRLRRASVSAACHRKCLFLFDQDPSPSIDNNLPSTVSMKFLDSCYLCRYRLSQGHDVFMYNGDKAFCSAECRVEQIIIDERKEKRIAPSIVRSGSGPTRAQNAVHYRRFTVPQGY